MSRRKLLWSGQLYLPNPQPAVPFLPMNESDARPTEERLAELERAVADLQHKLSQLTQAAVRHPEPRARDNVRVSEGQTPPDSKEPPAQPPRTDRTASPPTAARVVRRRTKALMEETPWQALLERGPQFWISRLGIGLVLLAVVFLFDYAIDRGWLTPPIRVAIGLALGAVLALVGLQVRRKERWFSQVMLGGASATWYITGFAAFQLLHLFSYPLAFAFMVMVTVFTFWAGIREDGAALAVLGAIGGLGTPFFLYTEQGSLPGLVGYTCLVLVGTSGIYLLKGWRSLLWTSVIGGWTVLLLAYEGLTPGDRWALQGGIVAAWLIFWLVTVGRESLASDDPARWPRPQSRLRDVVQQAGLAVGPPGDLAVLTAALPVGALFFARAVWQSGDVLWGAIALGVGLLYAGATAVVRRKPDLGVLASAHSVAAATLTVIAVALLFGHDLQILSWAALGVAFLYLGGRLDDAGLHSCGHVLFFILAFWLLQRLAGGEAAEMAVFTGRGLSDAAVILGFLAASRWSGNDSAKWYLLAAHAAFLGWLWRELTVLPAGQAIVTASFGVYGLTLLVSSAKTRKVGLATLLIAVAKLFLVDLERVDPFLRILLFLGFGGLFLAISYYYRDRWQSSGGDGATPDEASES